MRRIAVIGLTTLEYIAVKSTIDSVSQIVTELIPDSVDNYEYAERFDKFIISSDIFSRHADFFLPKKNRTLIICKDNCISENNLLTVGCNGDLIDILSAFERFCKENNDQDMSSGLSIREIEVLKELVNGLTIKEIADKLCISTNTASSHRKNISAKLGIRSISGLSVYAIMNGII